MNALTIQQRRAQRYAAIRLAGDRYVLTARAHLNSTSSTPTLQGFFESPRGVVLMLVVGLAFFAYAVSGGFQ